MEALWGLSSLKGDTLESNSERHPYNTKDRDDHSVS